MGRHKLNNVGVGNMKRAYANIPEGHVLLFLTSQLLLFHTSFWSRYRIAKKLT